MHIQIVYFKFLPLLNMRENKKKEFFKTGTIARLTFEWILIIVPSGTTLV